jgi:hypothetical protein
MSSQWVDANGTQWRFSSVAKTWQKQVGNQWRVATLPPGGLRRFQPSASSGPGTVIIETMGPRGPKGDPGPPGRPGTSVQISEVLSSEYQDGVNVTFPLSNNADLSQAFQVYRNGLMEMPGHGYLVTPTHVTFTTPPLDSDVLTVIYQKAQ